MKPAGIARTAREVFLTLGAVLGVVCLVLTAAGFAFGVVPLIFRSGSMSPAIHTGDLAISRTVAASTLKPGDIVSVVNPGGNRVTHRLVNAARQGDARQLTLKGDANKKADTEIYTVAKAQRVLFTIPKAGYAVNAASSPVGVFILGLYVAVLLLTVFRRGTPKGPTGPSDPKDQPARTGRRRRADRSARLKRSPRAPARSAAMAVVVSTLVIAAPAIAAPWTNPVPITGGTYAAYTVPKPAITTCKVTGGGQRTATITFTEVSSPYPLDYTGAIVETGQSLAVVDNGATRTVAFSAGLLSTVLNATYNIRITAKLPAPNGSWVSVNSNQPVTIGLLGLSMSCGTAT